MPSSSGCLRCAGDGGAFCIIGLLLEPHVSLVSLQTSAVAPDNRVAGCFGFRPMIHWCISIVLGVGDAATGVGRRVGTGLGRCGRCSPPSDMSEWSRKSGKEKGRKTCRRRLARGYRTRRDGTEGVESDDEGRVGGREKLFRCSVNSYFLGALMDCRERPRLW